MVHASLKERAEQFRPPSRFDPPPGVNHAALAEKKEPEVQHACPPAMQKCLAVCPATLLPWSMDSWLVDRLAADDILCQ